MKAQCYAEESPIPPGNVCSADSWRELLNPIVERYATSRLRKQFRGDAGFARPDICEYLEEHEFLYAIRLPANAVLERELAACLERPEELEPWHPVVTYHDFAYQAGTWERARRVVAKIEGHAGELFPRVGFIVTNLRATPEEIVHFYNGRGTAEQWIKGGSRLPRGKYALNWTRLSCHRFVANQVRLALFVLAYNLGNFLRRLALPASGRHWSLRSIQVKLIKIGAKVMRHARQVIFQRAEVAVSKELFAQILARIRALAPGTG